MTSASPLRSLIADARVIVCCGTGGVGKTTAAAALALAGAHAGRRTAVITIDPARRLASALGLQGLSNAPQPVPNWNDGTALPGGSLDALMLDSKTTFDELIQREARTPQQAERIMHNVVYRNLSSALGGTQEYMAVEKLYELVHQDRYDLVIVDTPPTRHALDVLNAPGRLVRLLDNPLFQALTLPARTPLRFLGSALQGGVRTLARVIGAEVLDDAVAFLQAFEGMESGFRERARSVEALLGERTTAFVVVTTLQRDALHETEFFAQRLHDLGHSVDGIVINRVLPQFGSSLPSSLHARATSLAVLATADGPSARDDDGRASAARLAERVGVLADLRTIAVREAGLTQELAAVAPEAARATLSQLAGDVHDVPTLRTIATALCGSAAPGSGD